MNSASKRQKKRGGNSKKGSGCTNYNRHVVDLTKFGFTSTSSAEKKKKKRTASAAAPGPPTDGDDEVEIVASPPKRPRTGNDDAAAGPRRNGGNGGGSAGPSGKSFGATVDLTTTLDDPEGGEGKKAAAANDGRTAGLVTVGAMARSLIAGMPGRDGRADVKRPAVRSPLKSSAAAAAQSPSRSVSSNRSAASSRAGRHVSPGSRIRFKPILLIHHCLYEPG